MTRVSVIIPAYNEADVVGRAIDSVLTQTVEDIECLVVDDASTDGTVAITESYNDQRIQYLRHERNRGGSAARNTGIEAASGDFISFLDADDEWRSKKLERQLRRYEQGDCRAVYCDTIREREGLLKCLFDPLFDEVTGREGGEDLVPEILMMQLSANAGSTLLVESGLVSDLGGFDPSFDRHQDLEFLVRLLQRGRLGFVNESLVRIHESSYPQADDLKATKRQFFQTFAETIEEAERNGYPVQSSHRFELAKAYCREGRFVTGGKYLRNAHATNTRQYAGLAWSLLAGIRRTVR